MRIVTLTTDFGTADGYVGAMKGVILGRCPDAVVVDIAHDIGRHDVAAGAHAVRQVAGYFPEGTIHVGVVDPGVGSDRQAVIVDDGRSLFVGPDNGLFALAVPEPVAVYRIEAEEFRERRPSATFHGRDVFATAAGRLAAGARPDEAGPRCRLEGSLGLGGENTATDGLGARVVHVDVFGNLITELSADRIPSGAWFRVGDRDVSQLSRTFADVERGELIAYVGSAGTLEIAIREGNAAHKLGLWRGAVVEVIAA